MSMLNLMETEIPINYSKAVWDDKGYDLYEGLAGIIAQVTFIATSEALKAAKSKDYPTVLEFTQINGDITAAAIVRYIPNDDEKMPGHWNYVWTFYKEDIPQDARVLSLDDSNVQSYFTTVGQELQLGFRDGSCIAGCTNYFIKELSKWLNDNAKEGEEIGVKLDGVFQARAIVEDKEVVKSIELIGETKAIIKDDAGNEV